jgi:hypothetical protein
MANDERIFLRFWVSLSKQDNVCDVAIDDRSSTGDNACTDAQLSKIFKACEF